jgi:hypothetical protein
MIGYSSSKLEMILLIPDAEDDRVGNNRLMDKLATKVNYNQGESKAEA